MPPRLRRPYVRTIIFGGELCCWNWAFREGLFGDLWKYLNWESIAAKPRKIEWRRRRRRRRKKEGKNESREGQGLLGWFGISRGSVSFGVCEILCDFDFWFFKRERGPIRFRFVSWYQIGGSSVILFLKNGLRSDNMDVWVVMNHQKVNKI